MANCRQCQGEFVKNGRAVFCSVKCRNEFHHALEREKLNAKRKEERAAAVKNCKQCNAPFTSHFYRSEKKFFCSDDCRILFHKNIKIAKNHERMAANPQEPRGCDQCKTQFVPDHRGHTHKRFCTEECALLYRSLEQKLERAEIRMTTERICKMCDKPFTPNRTLKEFYCSAKCRLTINKKIYKMMQRCYAAIDTPKADHSNEVLQYSPNQLLDRLRTFPDWTTIREGTWHLDHIFPITAFVKRGIKDPKIICCLENMQPLTGPENVVKKDKYDPVEFEAWLDKMGFLATVA